MPAKRIWPGTAAEHADRSRVVELVQRVGHRRLRFTIYDLQRAMREEPGLHLTRTRELARHVHDLSRTLVCPTERRLAVSDAGAPEAEAFPAPRRARHAWVLADRWTEYLQAPPELDDLEKTLCALWVAYLGLGEEGVPTRAVTDVFQEIEELAPERKAQTSLRLKILAMREDALAERISVPGERWVRWCPRGPKPAHPHLDAWVATAHATAVRGATRVGGHATLGEAVRELVLLALRATRSKEWPHGRPVKLEDLRAVAQVNARAAEITERIQKGGRSLHTLLGDLTKSRINGTRRVHTRVVRIPRRLGELSYYEIPDDPGVEHRALYVLREELRSLTGKMEMDAISDEWNAAQRLASATDPVLHAIGAARVLSCWREVEGIEIVLDQLQAQKAVLSKRVREEIEDRSAKLQAFLARWGTRSTAETIAAAALAPFDLQPEKILGVPRPLLTAAEMWEFIPEKRRGKLSPSESFPRIMALRRFPNPDFVSRTDPDPRQSALTCVDRVDALIYLAEHGGAKPLAFLRHGAALLGRSLRNPALVRLLATSEERERRLAALAAIALLGDPGAGDLALQWLRNPGVPVLEVECALYALLIVRRIQPDEWPPHIRHPRELAVQRVWRDVIFAAKQGRWLLQR